MWTTQDVIASLPRHPIARLPAPAYTGASSAGIGLAVESMRTHTTDEGWQIFTGLEHAGYSLCGHCLPTNEVSVPRILEHHPDAGVVVVQDKREWDLVPKDFREPRACFLNVDCLAGRPDLFKLTILKDAQQRPHYHRESAEEAGVHGFIVYYAPAIVAHLAPYLRPEHMIRVYHTIDAGLVPQAWNRSRYGCLLSGARGGAYPLRERLMRQYVRLPMTTYLPHPSYQRRKCYTPDFLKTLSIHRVAICTASRYGFALRKIVEATACGCMVITDLPVDEVLPEIDGNLIRVRPDISTDQVGALIRKACAEYDPARQNDFAQMALAYYDYRVAGLRLAADIERLRANYPCS